MTIWVSAVPELDFKTFGTGEKTAAEERQDRAGKDKPKIIKHQFF